MRAAFAEQIEKLANDDDRVILLSGDIGNRMFDSFKHKFPSRFINCGVAEANMISMAAGMANEGMRPFCYTITPFVTFRCMEQIKVDICYHNVPVTIVGTGAGLCYAALGVTHQSLEDIAMMRSLPNMNVLCPGDSLEIKSLLRCTLQQSSPTYMRIGKKGEPIVHQKEPALSIGKGFTLINGKQICLITTGNTLPLAMKVLKALEVEKLAPALVSMHTVKPLDHQLLDKIFESFQTIVSIEEHSIIGGLGSSIAEWLVDHNKDPSKFLRIGTPDNFIHNATSPEHARKQYELTPQAIVKKIFQHGL